MFRQSAPWLKEFPRYIPPEHTKGRNDCTDRRPLAQRAAHAGKDYGSARNANFEFVALNTENVEEAVPKRRLRKNDFRRLRRFQNRRMQVDSACRGVMIAVLLFGWLFPIYLVSHASSVCAMAHACGALIQSALTSPALKNCLDMVHAA